ncbi:MAG: transposase [Proteobacteria bacterium]|nr:transposase [Pseudomonadota bacterium]
MAHLLVKGRYDYRKITAALKNKSIMINHKCVQRLMGILELKCQIRPVRYHSYKGNVGRSH